ncbi:FMN-linked oxidoreductase [Thelephora ganbajun]|uniref:FMN-linked oxidoreductase n=1 Tax=Thelephora ganbajun TaxID=370292 RepID=A0ACB6ZH88_THEGA|nr:FMN-linked oxidoreductase [Thelephora ganbajun]
MSFVNKRNPNAGQYFPRQEPAIGAAYPTSDFPQNEHLPKLFQPITIGGLTFKNRAFVSPMCQYSADNGHATDWHLVHIGGFVTRGAGAVVVEATAVVPEGRISPEDLGLWADSQIEPLKRIVNFAHGHDTLIGIQLAHAGRKASALAPWIYENAPKTVKAPRHLALEDDNGWPNNVYGPSDIPFGEDYAKPIVMTKEDIQRVEDAYIAAVERCKQIGFDFIEIHAAHGYLLSSFLSPMTNTRTDDFGGQSLENRMRWPLRLIKRVREAWSDKPLFVRISGTEWAGDERDGHGRWLSWGLEQSKIFTAEVQKIGVDLIDVSSGGNYPKQEIPTTPGYQVYLADGVKKALPEIKVGTVGLIFDGKQANDYLEEGKADVIFLGREFLRDPHFVLRAALELGTPVNSAGQYQRAWTRLWKPQSPSSHL